MPLRGPNAASSRGGGGLANVAHDSSLVGSGTAGNPLGVAPAERAAARAVHGVLRETLAEWDVTLAAHAGGVGYSSEVNNSLDGSPTTVQGAISPTPPLLRIGGTAWRVAAIRQRADNNAVELRLGAPNSQRARRANGALAVPAGSVWVETGAALDAARDTTYTFRVPNAAATGFVAFAASAGALRALTAQAAGGAASPAAEAVGRDYLQFAPAETGAAIPWLVGRDADSILLTSPVSESPAVAIDADDGPPTAEAPAVPADADWRVGDLTLHTEDARASYSPRRVAGGRQSESLRTLTWTGVRPGTLAAGATTLAALGPAVDAARLLPVSTGAADAGKAARLNARGDAWDLYTPSASSLHLGSSAPAAPVVGALWVDTSNAATPELKTWNGSVWSSVDDHDVHAGASLPTAAPSVGATWWLTAQDTTTTPGTTYAPGWYGCHTPGEWTFVGPQPQTSQQLELPFPPRLVTLWGASAAKPADPLAGLAAGAYGDDGWIARPAGWHPNPADAVVPGGQSRWSATALGTRDSATGRWSFGAAHVAIADAYSVQYSTNSDGRAAHAAPTAQDVYYRRRDPGTGAWSPWLRIHAARDERNWITLVDYSANVGTGGHFWRYSHSLPAAVRPADHRELLIECQIDAPAHPAWRASAIVAPNILVAGNGDTAHAFRANVTLAVNFDADGTRRVSVADVVMPSEDVNVSSGRRWGIRGQFRRGPADPAGTASYFDVLFTRVVGLAGRYQVRIR